MHQFSRDAGVAEAWLLGQEPYLSSREMGQSVDDVEKLIKRHEAFEKSAATWEERFSALERLTTVSTEGQTLVLNQYLEHNAGGKRTSAVGVASSSNQPITAAHYLVVSRWNCWR